MEDLLHEMKADLKEIKADIKMVSQILDKNTASLIVHEHRTTLSEKRIESLENTNKWVLGAAFSAALSILGKYFLSR